MCKSWCWAVITVLIAAPSGWSACRIRPRCRARSMVRCCALATILIASPAPAEDPAVKPDSAGKLIRESWDAAYLQGEKAGYFHTTLREITRNGEIRQRFTRELHLTVRRGGSINVIQAESGDEETANGKVV